MTKQKTRVLPERIWIELPPPDDDAHADKLCTLANNLLQRLNPTPIQSEFFWMPQDKCYCFGGQHGYVTLSDRGEWFNLDYLGRAPEPQKVFVLVTEDRDGINASLYATRAAAMEAGREALNDYRSNSRVADLVDEWLVEFGANGRVSEIDGMDAIWVDEQLVR